MLSNILKKYQLITEQTGRIIRKGRANVTVQE